MTFRESTSSVADRLSLAGIYGDGSPPGRSREDNKLKKSDAASRRGGDRLRPGRASCSRRGGDRLRPGRAGHGSRWRTGGGDWGPSASAIRRVGMTRLSETCTGGCMKGRGAQVARNLNNIKGNSRSGTAPPSVDPSRLVTLASPNAPRQPQLNATIIPTSMALPTNMVRADAGPPRPRRDTSGSTAT